MLFTKVRRTCLRFVPAALSIVAQQAGPRPYCTAQSWLLLCMQTLRNPLICFPNAPHEFQDAPPRHAGHERQVMQPRQYAASLAVTTICLLSSCMLQSGPCPASKLACLTSCRRLRLSCVLQTANTAVLGEATVDAAALPGTAGVLIRLLTRSLAPASYPHRLNAVYPPVDDMRGTTAPACHEASCSHVQVGRRVLGQSRRSSRAQTHR